MASGDRARPASRVATRTRIGLDDDERRSIVLGIGFRIVGTPLIGIFGVLNSALVIHETGSAVFGIVSAISAIALLFPFSDLGIGATVTTASAQYARGTIAVDRFRRVITRAVLVLTLVSTVFVVAAVVGYLTKSWSALFSTQLSSTDELCVSIAVATFGLAVPFGLGVRVLTGLGHNHQAVLVSLSASAFTLGATAILAFTGATGLAFAIPPVSGLVLSGAVAATLGVRLARRVRIEGGPAGKLDSTPLLAGSLWMFLINIGLPIGLQWGRLVVANTSTKEQLSAYGLGAQLYGLCWMVIATGGAALWPVFVNRRDDMDETIRLWRRCLLLFTVAGAGLGAALLAASGLIGRWISGSSIHIDVALAGAFALLLLAQSVHLPSGMLLTRPEELRWQSGCVLIMAAISVSLALMLVPELGAAGAVLASAVGILVGQVVPDLTWTARKVYRRPLGEASARHVPASAGP